MNILIAGCGNVGYTLAETLSAEGHNITIIDSDPQTVRSIANRLDVVGVCGNGTSFLTLKDAGLEQCDVLIATTNHDEVNLLCCLIARRTVQCKTIARVRNPDYYAEIDFIRDELGIAMIINPEFSAAAACLHLIRAQGAVDVDSFSNGRVQMVTAELPASSKWVGKNLIEIRQTCKQRFLIAMVSRGKTSFIPHGNSVLSAGDRVSIIADSRESHLIFHEMGIGFRRIRDVMIAGCGNVGYYLAKRLLAEHYRVRIIDPSETRCRELCDLLPEAQIVCADCHNELILQEEGIAEMDAVAALSANDSDNVVLALYASRVSKAKLITRINKITLGGITSDLPIGAVVSPKHLTAEFILRYARVVEDDASDSRMEAVHLLAGGKVETLSFTVLPDSAMVNIRLMDLKLKKGILLGAIIREGQVILPSGQDVILPGDDVILLTEHKGTRKLRDILR